MLLQGPSGAGKSDLARRAIAAGWRLVADDRVRVGPSGGALYGAAPATLAGLIEVRGLGVMAEAALPFARMVLAMAPPGESEAVERIPDPDRLTLLDVELPRVRLAFCEASALAKLERALDAALRRQL